MKQVLWGTARNDDQNSKILYIIGAENMGQIIGCIIIGDHIEE
jgi:hypothetical protein